MKKPVAAGEKGWGVKGKYVQPFVAYTREAVAEKYRKMIELIILILIYGTIKGLIKKEV